MRLGVLALLGYLRGESRTYPPLSVQLIVTYLKNIFDIQNIKIFWHRSKATFVALLPCNGSPGCGCDSSMTGLFGTEGYLPQIGLQQPT
jgi:hypothetical protein